MGTSLVPYKPSAHLPEAARKRIVSSTEDRSQKLNLIAYGLLVGAIGSLIIFLLTALLKGPHAYAPIFISMAVFLGCIWSLAGMISGSFLVDDWKRETIPCPHCAKHVDLWKPWFCGSCRAQNGIGIRPFLTYETPLSGCASCAAVATAVQCPECSRHIVIDGERYVTEGGNQKPLCPGVAVYCDDENEAVFETAFPDGSGAFRAEDLMKDFD